MSISTQTTSTYGPVRSVSEGRSASNYVSYLQGLESSRIEIAQGYVNVLGLSAARTREAC
jgi:hypothetical protein